MKTKEKVTKNFDLWDSSASTPEGQEDQMVACAMELSKERMRNGTASSQEIVYWLKVGSLRERQEREKLKEEIKLLNAKTEAINAEKEHNVQYEKVLEALIKYTPHGPEDI